MTEEEKAERISRELVGETEWGAAGKYQKYLMTANVVEVMNAIRRAGGRVVWPNG